jgi:hypothetical protein
MPHPKTPVPPEICIADILPKVESQWIPELTKAIIHHII